MATQNIGLSAQVTTTAFTQTISASYIGNGTPLSYTQPTSGVMLINVGLAGAQYRIDSGEWIVLDKNEGNYIPADLSVNRVGVKLINDGSVSTKLEYVVESMPTAYVGRTGETFPVANPPVTVTGYRYSGAIATAVPGTGYTFTAGQWYRNGVAIGGQTALTYTRTDTDIGTALTFIPTGIAFSASGGTTLSTPVDTSLSYVRFNAAMAATLAGTGYTKVVPVGDSTTTGYGSLGTTSLTNVRPISPTALLRAALASAQARPVIANSWVGDGGVSNNGATLYQYDPRLTLPDGAGWANSITSALTAGCRHQVNSTNANRMAFLPVDGSCDTFEITTPINGTLGSLNVARTGMSNTAINQAGTAGIAKTTLVSTLSNANPLYINRTAGLGYVMGVDAWDSSVKSVRLLGVGWNAGKTADWIDSATAFNPFPALKAIGAHLYVIRPGINEWLNAVPVATFKANLETLVDGLLVVGDVLICTPYPSKETNTPLATQTLYVNAIREVAAARNLAVEDTFAKWGSWEAANALGYMSDDLHPKQAGYQAAATDCAAKIVSLVA